MTDVSNYDGVAGARRMILNPGPHPNTRNENPTQLMKSYPGVNEAKTHFTDLDPECGEVSRPRPYFSRSHSTGYGNGTI